jgi:hypothetical protein
MVQKSRYSDIERVKIVVFFLYFIYSHDATKKEEKTVYVFLSLLETCETKS